MSKQLQDNHPPFHKTTKTLVLTTSTKNQSSNKTTLKEPTANKRVSPLLFVSRSSDMNLK